MSKIEEAMEKARQLRENEVRSGHPGEPAQPSMPSPDPLPPGKIDISSPLLVAANNYNLPIAEEYRKLKSVIVQMTKRDGFRNTIMVTSSLDGEGKSITALNLAISIAQEHDHYVLLVDADLRRPSLCNYLGLKPEVGLVDCLANGMDVGKALIKTGLGNLSLLPAGKPIINPVELFSSRKMKDLLDEIKNRYDDRYIVIDTTSVLPFAEARLIGNIVDGVVFVVKEGRTSLHNVQEAVGSLRDVNVLGVVYNQATTAGLAGGYHYYYDENYYYKTRSAPLPGKHSKAGFLSRILKQKDSR